MHEVASPHMRSEIHFEGAARAQLMAQLLQPTYPCNDAPEGWTDDREEFVWFSCHEYSLLY